MRSIYLLPGFVLAGCLLINAAGCGEADKPTTKGEPAPAPTRPSAGATEPGAETPGPRAEGGPHETILLSQAQFVEKTDEKTGKTKSLPGAARLVILRRLGDTWKRELLEDPESNVFHKSALYPASTEASPTPGILTIGANAAAIKLWHPASGQWTAKTLWQTTFGGKQNRLRDFEIGDVTGDKQDNIAIVTHDQGVVAVLSRGESGWEATEIDRKPKTFVHEVELGDLDGDGLLEIYATPSQPNKFDGTPQPGEIVSYHHTPEGFKRQVVEEFPLRHVKEILVADADGSGRPALWASLEAELGRGGTRSPDADKILLRRYRFENGEYVGQTICSLDDGLCRFLNAGDVDGDGKPELIASTHKRGIWLIRPTEEQPRPELIDADSSGFEHATVLADLDGDGAEEIYVAADDQREVRCYRWTGENWQRTKIFDIEPRKITFGITVGRL